MEIEEWRPIPGYEGAYEVSSHGRVRSLPRMVNAGGGRKRRHPMTYLSIYRGDHYSKVRLKIDGSGSTKNVHSLVAEAFLGPRPDGMEVCHNNGDGHDNRVENLRWDSHQENQRDLVRHGAHAYARRTRCNRGHEFTPDNTGTRGPKERGRRCLTCERERNARRWQEELERRRSA